MQTLSRRRFTRHLVIVGTAGLLAGCGVRPWETGAMPEGHARYPALAVVPLLADTGRIVKAAFWSQQTMLFDASDWQIREKAARIVAETLAPTGGEVIAITDALSFPVDANAADWATQVVSRLRQSGRLGDAQAILLLRQNAIDLHGRQYNPMADLLVSGLIGLVVSAVQHRETYQPTITVGLPGGFSAALGERTACGIGFDAWLMSPDGATLAYRSAFLGLEPLPAGLAPEAWDTLAPAQRIAIETYCIAALRRGVLQAVQALGLVQR